MPSFDQSVKDAVNTPQTDSGNVTAKVASSSPKIASSIFETGPKDAIVVADRFGKRAVSWVNQEAAGIKGAFDGFFSNNRIIALTKSTLKDIGTTANSALKAVNDSKKQLESYTGLNLSSLGAAKASLNNAAITTMSSVTGYDMQRVMRNADDIQRIASNADLGSVNSLFSTANRLLGTEAIGNLVDMRSESSVLGSLLNQASQLGMPDMFDKLWDKVDKNDKMYGDNIARYSAAISVPTVLYNGDILMLNKLIDKLGGESILQQYPTAITDFLGNYVTAVDATPGDYPALRVSISDTMARLDPEWLKLDSTHSDTYRLDPFLKANNVVLAIFQSGAVDMSTVANAQAQVDRVAVSALIASSYPKQSGSSLLKAYYPNIPYA